MLSCECSDDYDSYYYPPDHYSICSDPMIHCCSCKSLIDFKGLCVEFECYEINEDEDEIETPSEFMCEHCGDIYFSLKELGFCIDLGDSILELLEEYHKEYLK